MASNVAKGAYYKSRSRKWLEAHGFTVFDMEVVRFVGYPNRIPVKRDQLGADLGAMNAERLILIQCKGGDAATGGTFPQARREFGQFVFPDFVERWILGWPPRAREPRIIVVTGEQSENFMEVTHP